MESLGIILAGAVVLNVMLFIVFNPYFGLLLFTALLYLRPQDIIPFLTPLHLARLVAGFTILVLIFKNANKLSCLIKNSTQTTLMHILIFVMLISITTSIWKSNSMNHFINFIKVYMGFFLVMNLADSIKRMKGIAWVMVISGFAIGIMSVLNYLQGVNVVGVNNRVRGFVGGMFNNPNDLALCLLMLMPFAYFFFARSKSVFLKIFSIFCMIFFFFGFIFTKSRGGALALFGMLLFIFLRSRNKVKVAIGILLFAILFLTFAPSGYLDRIKTIPTSHKSDDASISRMDAWKAGIRMMTHRPLGVGIGNFGEGFVKYRPPDAIDLPGLRRAAHNAFIEIGGESGFIGLLVFILLILASARSLDKAKKILIQSKFKNIQDIGYFADSVLLSMVSFIISAFFLSQAYNWIFYYLVAFSVVLDEFVKRKSYEKAA
jgi:probable O-glycosylation ligase (exosortase A-associated)